MRISLRHEITYKFEKPVSSLLRVLRVTPWAIENQHLDAWRIDVDCDCRLRIGDDAYGNVVDTISCETPLDAVSIVAQGEIVTTETNGIVRNALERFPPDFYLRDTELTASDESIREFADKIATGASSPLDKLHALLVALSETLKVESADAAQSAIETFREEKGSPGDLAHVFIAAARHIGAPARFVRGALVPDMFPDITDANHAWAEAHVPGIGWIGFDPVHGLCAHEGHVRVAFALDSIAAAAVRSAPALGVTETVKTKMTACESCEIKSRQERSFGMTQEQFQR